VRGLCGSPLGRGGTTAEMDEAALPRSATSSASSAENQHDASARGSRAG
jgi:hypothetical protein